MRRPKRTPRLFYLRTLCNCFPPFNLRSDSPGISRQRANCGCSALLSHLHFKSLIHVRAGPSGSAVCTCTATGERGAFSVEEHQPRYAKEQSSTPICITTGQYLHFSFLLTISSLNDAKRPPFKLDFSSKVQSGWTEWAEEVFRVRRTGVSWRSRSHSGAWGGV